MFTSFSQAKRFLLAGNARATFVSAKTGTRFTYKVRAKEFNGRTFHFVSVLTGSNNDSDYTFIGTIFESNTFSHSRKSRIGNNAPSVLAFQWVFNALKAGVLPTTVEIHHEGRCGKCAKPLTVPASIESGFGPICMGME